MLKRLMERIEKKDNGCWEWTGRYEGAAPSIYITTGEGKSRQANARRLMFETSNDTEVGKGYRVFAACGNNKCCNPDHAEVLTESEHSHRSGLKGGNKTIQLTKEQLALALGAKSHYEAARITGLSKGVVQRARWAHGVRKRERPFPKVESEKPKKQDAHGLERWRTGVIPNSVFALGAM